MSRQAICPHCGTAIPVGDDALAEKRASCAVHGEFDLTPALVTELAEPLRTGQLSGGAPVGGVWLSAALLWFGAELHLACVGLAAAGLLALVVAARRIRVSNGWLRARGRKIELAQIVEFAVEGCYRERVVARLRDGRRWLVADNLPMVRADLVRRRLEEKL